MPSTITLSPSVYDLVAKRAAKERTTADALAEGLLRRAVEDTDEWRQAFDTLIARVRSRTAHYDSTEIESDITAAAAETKELRRARRGS